MVWNGIVVNKEYLWRKWEGQENIGNLLKGYRAKVFLEEMRARSKIKRVEIDFVLKILDHIKAFDDGVLVVVLFDGTEIECRSEEV